MPSNRPTVTTFLKSIAASPHTKAFRVLHPHADEPQDWQLEPLDVEVLSDDGQDGFYVIAAINVLPDARADKCYMDMTLPERINDYAYFIEATQLRYDRPYKFDGEIIPAIAIDCVGVYELFYSRTAPEIGIDVLKRGLAASKRKCYIAQDLAYILRDEKRYREAAEMFQLVADEEPPSYFVYAELADAYAKIGDRENYKKYADLFKRHEPDGA